MRHVNRRLFAAVMICIGIAAAACDRRQEQTGGPGAGRKEGSRMKVTSPEFGHNEMIPARFTADGENVNPPLDIEGVPDGAESLVLIMDDPDAPAGTWIHWVVYDIAVTPRIEANSIPGTQGGNSFGRTDYGGPAPPSGTHRYFFKLYALDQKLDLAEGKSKADVEAAMKGHVLDSAELVGLYKRK